MKKIGIYGGSFNPPHNGHIIACNEFYKAMKLDKLFIVPTGTAPHKLEHKILVSSEDRYNMATLAFSDYGISDFESKSNKISYTAITVAYFKKRFPNDEIIIYMSSDMVYTLQDWYLPKEIAKNCKIVCAMRYKKENEKLKSHTKFLKETFDFDIEIIEFTPLIISSTTIREMLHKKQDVSDYLPTSVLNYINEKGLYNE